MAKIINMQEAQQKAFKSSGSRKKKVLFIVNREFVGNQTMEDMFSRLVERRMEEQYRKWHDGRETHPDEEQILLKAS